MSALFSYSLTVSLVVMMLFPVLHQIVNRCTSFRFNRMILLSGMLLSLALPFIMKCDISLLHSTDSATTAAKTVMPEFSVSSAASSSEQQSPNDVSLIIPILIITYIAGVALLLLREIFSFIRLFQLIAKSDKTKVEGLTICRMNDPQMAPFSWGNYIFMHDSDFDKGDSGIFLHEKAHTIKRHWIDVLFADLFCILLWYNPFAWLTRQLVRLNHEFEADAAVIESGIDPYIYQHLLVTKAMGMRAIPVTNAFSLNKRGFRKRVLTISRNRSSNKVRLIALCAIPAIAIAAVALSTPLSASILNSISKYSFEKVKPQPTKNHKIKPKAAAEEPSVQDTSVVKADALIVLESPLKNQAALANIIKASLSAIELEKDTKVNIGIVINEEGKVINVVTDNTDDPLIKAIVDQTVSGLRFEEIKLDGKPIQTKFNIPVVIQKKS